MAESGSEPRPGGNALAGGFPFCQLRLGGHGGNDLCLKLKRAGWESRLNKDDFVTPRPGSRALGFVTSHFARAPGALGGGASSTRREGPSASSGPRIAADVRAALGRGRGAVKGTSAKGWGLRGGGRGRWPNKAGRAAGGPARPWFRTHAAGSRAGGSLRAFGRACERAPPGREQGRREEGAPAAWSRTERPGEERRGQGPEAPARPQRPGAAPSAAQSRARPAAPTRPQPPEAAPPAAQSRALGPPRARARPRRPVPPPRRPSRARPPAPRLAPLHVARDTRETAEEGATTRWRVRGPLFSGWRGGSGASTRLPVRRRAEVDAGSQRGEAPRGREGGRRGRRAVSLRRWPGLSSLPSAQTSRCFRRTCRRTRTAVSAPALLSLSPAARGERPGRKSGRRRPGPGRVGDGLGEARARRGVALGRPGSRLWGKIELPRGNYVPPSHWWRERPCVMPQLGFCPIAHPSHHPQQLSRGLRSCPAVLFWKKLVGRNLKWEYGVCFPLWVPSGGRPFPSTLLRKEETIRKEGVFP